MNEDTMIVSHLPFIDCLTSYLLTGSAHRSLCLFHPGTIVCLERVGRGSYYMNWMIAGTEE